MNASLQKYTYTWPNFDIHHSDFWNKANGSDYYVRNLPEEPDDLKNDSRWPALFPSAMCIVTTGDGAVVGLEKVVAPVVVNRFPYIMALSFCMQDLSERHYSRRKFTEILERGGSAAVQFIQEGDALDSIMEAIQSTDTIKTRDRVRQTGLKTRKAISHGAPVFNDAYLIYEAKLVEPARDFEGNPIYQKPFLDVGSHRVYFLEISTIQLREDVAKGERQIAWESLPTWEPQNSSPSQNNERPRKDSPDAYQKPYNPHYKFPSKKTVAFVSDYTQDGMAVKKLGREVELDNDNARWPCFFPSPVNMVTSFLEDGTPNVMPCGSIAVVGRFPLTISVCVAYAAINERYRPRASLEIIRKAGKFGCGVPFAGDRVIKAITYSGNRSIKDDKRKLLNSGLSVDTSFDVPVLSDLPINFACRVVDEIRLGTHMMFLGEVSDIYVREDVTEGNPLRWYPWAKIITEGMPC